MKARILQFVMGLALIVVVPLALRAQQMSHVRPLLHVDIPFGFTAGGNHLPAGHYHVSHPADPNVLIIQNADNGARAVVFVHVSRTQAGATGTKLVFNRYGNQYFLSQAWTEADGEVHQTFRGKAELDMEARFGKPAQKIVLARK